MVLLFWWQYDKFFGISLKGIKKNSALINDTCQYDKFLAYDLKEFLKYSALINISWNLIAFQKNSAMVIRKSPFTYCCL